MNKKLKIVFAGTPDFAAKHLSALLESEHQVVAVYTQPDRPAGRGKKLQASPVKAIALENELPVEQPESFKEPQYQEVLAAYNADVMIVVAYGLLLPLAILETPKYGCINVHGSLLPRWRGAAPIQRAIWAGDKETGVTIMQMDEGLDTGPMLHKHEVEIDPEETSATLYEKLAISGPEALVYCLDNFSSLKSEKQADAYANYAKKLSKEEAKIDWSQPADQLNRNVRAFNPWPVCFFELNGQNIKVWKSQSVPLAHSHPAGKIISADADGILVATGQDGLLLQTIQIPGKKAMPVKDILNARGDWFAEGTQL